MDCAHRCCPSIAKGRTDKKKDEEPHVHVFNPEDCPSCHGGWYKTQT